MLGSKACFLSPDLVGTLYDRLSAMGVGALIFLNSAQGGMVTADNRRPEGRESRSWEECVRIGELLADETLRIIQGATEQADPKLFCAARLVTFPVDSPLMRELVKVLPGTEGADGKLVTQMNLINLGDVQILTIPGEALPNALRWSPMK